MCRRPEAREPRRLVVGRRMQSQRQLEKHAERAEGADHELRDIVAAHRLHDLRAAPRQHAVRLGEPYTQEQVAHRAVPLAQRAARLGRRDAAERARGPARRIERQHLPMAGQVRGEDTRGAAGLHGHGEIIRVVLEHGVEAAHLQHEIDAPRRMPELERGAAAARHDRQTLLVPERDESGCLLDAGRRRRPPRHDAIHRGTALAPVLGADDGAQGVAERGRGHRHRARPTCPPAASAATGESPRRTRGARAAAWPGS